MTDWMFPMQAEYSSKSSNQNEMKLSSIVVLVMKTKPNGKIEKGWQISESTTGSAGSFSDMLRLGESAAGID